MTTYILTPGFWLGGWAWREVTGRLRAAGHEVYPVTLTGLGERVHLARPQVDLDTHIDDVVNLLEYEDLRDVVLVGHSYAGIVVTGVADRVPDRIGRLAFVDSGPFPDGMAHQDFGTPADRAANDERVERFGDGWRLPLPDWSDIGEANLVGLGPRERALLAGRAVPQPAATFRQPLRLRDPAALAKLPKLGVLCTFTLDQVRQLATQVPLFAGVLTDEWQHVELSTGHWPMFSEPARLAEALTTTPGR
jgi:pimeloyl-ACP methyl ester carboxylesterase